ncbi:hypothetical protein GGI43DRAFT_385586 [Trichoderma evansii]
MLALSRCLPAQKRWPNYVVNVMATALYGRNGGDPPDKKGGPGRIGGCGGSSSKTKEGGKKKGPRGPNGALSRNQQRQLRAAFARAGQPPNTAIINLTPAATSAALADCAAPADTSAPNSTSVTPTSTSATPPVASATSAGPATPNVVLGNESEADAQQEESNLAIRSKEQ